MEQQTKTDQKWHILQLLQVHETQQLLQRFFKKRIQEGKPFAYWLEKNHYYYYRLRAYYRFIVPEGMRVLVLQCKNGYLLDAVKPIYGVGIDTDLAMISQAKDTYARYHFYHGTIADIKEREQFDYILLSSADAQLYDMRGLLESLKPFCHAGTRLIIDAYTPIWRPLIAMAAKSGFFEPQRIVQDFSRQDLLNFLMLSDYDPIKQEEHLLVPVHFPFLSTVFNRILINFPFIRRLALHRIIIARPLFIRRDIHEAGVSVIVPAANEKNLIEPLVKRLPHMGSFTELIFVCRDSSEDTIDEIKRMIQTYPEKSISFYRQQGVERAEEIRIGLSCAAGDIIMLADAGMSIEPEELSACYYALLENKGECVVGARFVYRMKKGARAQLHRLINRAFGSFVSWTIGQQVTDSFCSIKTLWKDDMQAIMRERSFSYRLDRRGELDLLFGAAKRHLKIVGLPVRYNPNRSGSWELPYLYNGLRVILVSLIAVKSFKGK